MKILVLYGRSNVGKTGTLLKLMDILHLKGSVAKTQPYLSSIDKTEIIIYNGKRIGITSRGDDKKTLEKSFIDMGECDLYICASRTKGETINYINAFQAEVYWQKRWSVLYDSNGHSFSHLYDKSQEAQAEHLAQVVDVII